MILIYKSFHFSGLCQWIQRVPEMRNILHTLLRWSSGTLCVELPMAMLNQSSNLFYGEWKWILQNNFYLLNVSKFVGALLWWIFNLENQSFSVFWYLFKMINVKFLQKFVATNQFTTFKSWCIFAHIKVDLQY